MGFFSDSVVLLMFRRPTGVSFLKSRRDAKALPRSDSVPMPITGLSDDHQSTFRCPSEIFPTGIRKSSDGHRNSVARGVTEEAESAARSDDSRRFGVGGFARFSRRDGDCVPEPCNLSRLEGGQKSGGKPHSVGVQMAQARHLWKAGSLPDGRPTRPFAVFRPVVGLSPPLGRGGVREVSRVRSSTGRHRKSCLVRNQ